MKPNIIEVFKMKLNKISQLALVMIISLFTFSACNQELPNDIVLAGPLTITTSNSAVELNQKKASADAFSLNWTTGTNNGTDASISYKLEIDVKGNDFSKALSYDMGKGIYTKNFNVKALNDSLLNRWGAISGEVVELESRIISTIYTTPATSETSAVITISVVPYQPVSTTLYIIGNASPKGWSVDNPIELKAQNDPTEFVYQGALSVGSFKFITTKGQFLPSYNKGADDTKIVLRTEDTQPDIQFNITENGVYKVVVNLLDMSITFGKIDFPAHSELYIFGSAAPNGWDIEKATQLMQSTSNPFIFTYQGVLNAGEFKFPVNRNADFNQDMFQKLDDTHMYLHEGGTPGDDKWTIDKKGFYTLTLNLLDNSITIYREKLYMVGSATPIGWTITNAIQMTEDATNGCIFTYNGPMVVGEFKLPVNRNGDFGQDMYQKISDTKMYRHIGGQADDNKWNITSAGNYVITANIETLTINFVKQ